MKPRGAPEPGAEARDRAPEARDEEDDERVVRCAACRVVVARAADRVERFGAREHDRVNPAGFVFRVACFADAPGARALGAPSLDFAWFPRAPWQVAICRACGVHLGWRFGGEAPFFGLSVEAIVEGAASE